VTTTEIPQEEKDFIKELRAKAKLFDKVVPKLQRDLAVVRADIDEDNPNARLWERDYTARVKAGEATWDPAAVRADAQQYGIVKPEMIDYSADIAAARRIEAASAEAVEIDPKDSARNRMAQARDMDQFIAAYRSQGGVVVDE
jgi:hypothetical protein